MVFMKLFALLTLMHLAAAQAENGPTLNFNYRDADLVKVIEDYAKASGQKFIIDPGAKGKITIVNQAPVTLREAFEQMSSAMMLNSVGISKQDQLMIVSPSRNIQRNLIEVGSELPPIRPDRMFTWVVALKYVSADEINKQLRILTSKDGELVPYTHSNKLVLSDWVSNLHRIAKILRELDVPAEIKAAKKAK